MVEPATAIAALGIQIAMTPMPRSKTASQARHAFSRASVTVCLRNGLVTAVNTTMARNATVVAV